MTDQTTETVDTPRAVVMFSGGLGSWLTARRAAEIHGPKNVILLFADVKGDHPDMPHVGEDEDTYRFIREAASDVGAELVTVMDGRNIWEVFRDDRFLGNSRLANCSKFLKQEPCRRWLTENADPETTTVYVGIDWSETHRMPAIERGWAPYPVRAPLTEPPYVDREQMQQACADAGIELPRLYKAGFAHNNCGGFCVRAGQAQMELLMREHPERYLFHETEEQKLRDYLARDVAVLTDRTQGAREAARRPDGTLPNRVPLTLRTFRERIEGDPSLFDELDVGGCGCFVAEEVGA